MHARSDRQQQRARFGLDALNAVLADVRDGLGPYLAIYLLAVRGPQQGWNEETIGFVITIAGIVGLVAQTPAGALIDRTRHKRTVVILAALLVTACSLCLPFISDFIAVAATQSAAAVAATVFPPALAAISLGIVGERALAARIGRNEAFNHTGNAAAAGVAAVTAAFLGPIVVFWILAALAACSVVATLIIPAEAIDDDAARGASDGGTAPSGWKILLTCRPLLVFAVLVALFHLANAAMLPTVGQLLTRVVGKNYATSLISGCIVAAQCVMVPVAIVVGRKADYWGRKPIFLAAFAVLAIRGALYTLSDNPWWLLGVQCLDGVGAGIYGALFPVIVADLTRGTGRFNVSQGAVATAQGIGASLSATLAGTLVVQFSFSAAFLCLGAIAAAGFALFLLFMPETRPESGRQRLARDDRHEVTVAE